MANALYPAFKASLLQAGIDLSSDDIRASLIDLADYSYNTSHDFWDDVASASKVSTLASGLASKTFTDGIFDAADATWSSVTGDQCEAVILYSNTGGADSARQLICYFDTGITGIPVTPNGGDINLNFNASGIFSL